jgi:hypothetical protein
MSATREALLVFGCFFLLYAATSPGDLMGDSEARWLIARRLAETGWFDLAPGSYSRLVEGRGGRFYFFTGPAQPVCLVPFVWAGQAVEQLPLGLGGSADLFGEALASLILFPVFGGVAVMLLYLIVRDSAGGHRAALGVCALFGLATMHWHNSVNTYEESQTAACALAALWAAQRAWLRGGWLYPLVACAAMGLSLCFRVSAVTLIGPIGVIALWRDAAGQPMRTEQLRRVGTWIAAGLVGAAPFMAALAVFNYVRFGSIWEAGYGPHVAQTLQMGLFDTPLLVGLSGMLFSPGKSVFLFNPVLLVSLAAFPLFWRTHRALALTAGSVFAGTVLFYAGYTFWSGDLAWGPRYLASSIGFCLLPLIPVAGFPRWRRLLAPVGLVSIVIQVASVVYGFGLEFAQDRRQGTIPDEYVWRPAESQLFRRFQNIARDLVGRPNHASIPPDVERPATSQVTTSRETVRQQHTVNVFPFKARALTGNRKLFRMLLAVWLSMWMLLGALIWFWYRRLRACGERRMDNYIVTAGEDSGSF